MPVASVPVEPLVDPVHGWSWALEFRSFTAMHALVFVVALGLIVGSVVLGGRWRGTKKELRLRLAWIWFTVAWQGFAVVWWLMPAHFDPTESLPLHLCDIAAWVAPLALWWSARFPRALLYFWGVGLSTQAFFTPVLQSGWSTYEFWLFWIGHLQIVGSAVYVVAVLGLRPTFADWVRVMAVNVVVLGAIVLVNQVLVPKVFACESANYWYVGSSKPGSRTIIDSLGAWPGRIAWIVALAGVAQLVAWVPFGIARRVRAGRGARADEPRSPIA